MATENSLLEEAMIILNEINECPFRFDEATIPESRNYDSPQVVVNLSIGWQRKLKLRRLLEKYQKYLEDNRRKGGLNG